MFPEASMPSLVRHAPDLFSWRSCTFEFRTNPEPLKEFLQAEVDRKFSEWHVWSERKNPIGDLHLLRSIHYDKRWVRLRN
jgi:hypothetical protein